MQAETAVGDSFTTQVIGEILNNTVAASEGPGHELCSPCVVTSNVLKQSLAARAMTELLRRSRRLEKYINNSSNQLVEEFQSRNVHVVHSQTSESHESRELVLLSLCL